MSACFKALERFLEQRLTFHHGQAVCHRHLCRFRLCGWALDLVPQSSGGWHTAPGLARRAACGPRRALRRCQR